MQTLTPIWIKVTITGPVVYWKSAVIIANIGT
jgi:hypothetical protein